jgi:hypothetical protein
MARFVPRLVALTLVWLLATAALTYAAAHRMGTAPAPVATTTAAAPPAILVVPDVRHQAYVFAKGTLGDAGFGWHVEGSVQGYASNTVAVQTPAPGTRVIDTGAPLVVLHLAHTGSQLGMPEEASPVAPTALKLADLALADTPPTATTGVVEASPAATAPVVTPVVTKQVAAAPVVVKKKVAAAPVVVKKKAAKPAPSKQLPQQRPPAFVVPGARREPLDEIPLTNRAALLMRWLAANPKPTDANVRHWLYQHAWIVAGAELGWWHGKDALQELIAADRKVWAIWGIGARSEADARKALAEVEARAS